MTKRLYAGVLIAVLAISMTSELLACGDKFLVGGRGTRYQRPKNARAASVLIFADPSSVVPATLKNVKVESLLKLEGHRSTKVETLDQLSAVVSSGRFDVILTAASASADVQKLVGGVPAPAIVLAIDDLAKTRSILQAIDKAVAERDEHLKRSQVRS